MQKPSIPQGTRDFSPIETARRRYIFDTVERVFRKYGFKQLETPAMENLSTLTGKYGDEGDKLLYKILNSGDFLKDVPEALLNEKDSKKLTPAIADRGLRYDLTVPFARYVVMRQHEISFPFKRYQIQPVWRADRPQKGRYREFYQCDVDVVGSDSLIYEAELCKIYDEVFQDLQLPVSIRINNRKILEGIAISAGLGDKFKEFTVIIDKLDKIGADKVKEEIQTLGVSLHKADEVMNLLVSGPLNQDTINKLADKLDNDIAKKGIEELNTILTYIETSPCKNEVLFDGTLARGLNYYTGTIFEVAALDVKMGSIGGGGRYDDLTGIFGLKGVSGVGVSFGADRIYDVLLETGKFPELAAQSTRILFCAMDDASLMLAFTLVQQCRAAGIASEIYPEVAKLKKPLGYANNNGIPFAVIIGENERVSGVFSFKDLFSGNQEPLNIHQIIEKLR